MIGTFSNLSVCALNAEQHMQTCNYWYTVMNSHAAHTAFTTKEGLQRWLDERGLVCNIPTMVKPEDYGKNLYNHAFITGTYRGQSHNDYDEFYALPVFIRTKVLDNADYTLGLITLDDDGIRTVHHMNCNCKERIVYDYRASQEEMK